MVRDRALVGALRGIVSQAAKTPETTGVVDALRLGRRIVLADISGSMDSPGAGGRKKIDILADALREACAGWRLVVFSSAAREASIEDPLTAGGNTAMHVGLDLVASMRPTHTLIISDGEPDSESQAIRAASAVPGVIDVLYVGPEGHSAARTFLESLARAHGGIYRAHDISQPGHLANCVHKMLDYRR